MAGASRSNGLAAFAYPRAQPIGHHRVHRRRQQHVRRSALRRPVPRSTTCSSAQEPVGLVTGTLALRGHEMSGELDVASPRLAMTGTGRIALDADSRRRPDVPVPRQFARSVRAAVRAEAVAVHHGGGQRIDPRRRQAGRRRSSAGRRHRRHGSTCACSTTRSATRGRSASRSTIMWFASTICSWSATRRTSRSAAPSRCTRSGSRARRRVMRTSGSCRGSSATSAARAAPRSPRPSTVRCTSRCSPAAPRSRTAASATSRCRTRSTRSTATIRFDSRGFVSTT